MDQRGNVTDGMLTDASLAAASDAAADAAVAAAAAVVVAAVVATVAALVAAEAAAAAAAEAAPVAADAASDAALLSLRETGFEPAPGSSFESGVAGRLRALAVYVSWPST